MTTKECRQHHFKRAVFSLAMSRGDWSGEKLIASSAKLLFMWTLFKYPVEYINKEYALLFVGLLLVAPDLLKKWLNMRAGGSPNNPAIPKIKE